MRCQDVKKMLDEVDSEAPVAVREHIADCVACQSEAQGRELLRAGFMALAQEPILEPSIGFTARLLRRLDEVTSTVDPAREFFERAGRRVVYLGVAAAMAVLFALTLPSWSPLHGASAIEFYPAPQVQRSETDPVLADDSWLGSHFSLVNSSGPERDAN